MALQESDDLHRQKKVAWMKLCKENGWVCKLCGSTPAIGQRLEDQLCEDCRLQVRNE